ncbi:MAG: sigma-54-dependent Fis family transcriptional regulator [Proteobacteria bacterium]|nr:sigma-54-dependent Fis family transcriptional regulator [Pseudomonadota bacterium]
MSNLLIIDDDVASCRTLQLHFRSQGHIVNIANSSEEGLAAAKVSIPDVIVLDIRMPGKDGLEVLPEFKKVYPDTPVIMITAHQDMDSTITAMQRGADDYIHKPIDIHELDDAMAKALSRNKFVNGDMSVVNGAGAGLGNGTMFGSSRLMKEVFKTIGLVASKPVNILITGESGTGKELVARAIHDACLQSSGEFVAVNCAALVETLLESELFGHEKGAFTGAISKQIGKFAIADNGTIFLDEISELSLIMQAKLLRILQEKEYVPLGGNKPQISNARVIAATNADLSDKVKKGLFREDFFYRLQVVTIQLPPLRERKEDILGLVQTMFTRINRDMHRKIDRLSMDVIESFQSYDWPGNVRELENVLTKAVALCTGDIITREHIPKEICGWERVELNNSKTITEKTLDDIEKEHVARILEATDWHRGKACKILGVSRPKLRRMIKQYGIVQPAGIQYDEEEYFSQDIDERK